MAAFSLSLGNTLSPGRLLPHNRALHPHTHATTRLQRHPSGDLGALAWNLGALASFHNACCQPWPIQRPFKDHHSARAQAATSWNQEIWEMDNSESSWEEPWIDWDWLRAGRLEVLAMGLGVAAAASMAAAKQGAGISPLPVFSLVFLVPVLSAIHHHALRRNSSFAYNAQVLAMTEQLRSLRVALARVLGSVQTAVMGVLASSSIDALSFILVHLRGVLGYLKIPEAMISKVVYIRESLVMRVSDGLRQHTRRGNDSLQVSEQALVHPQLPFEVEEPGNSARETSMSSSMDVGTSGVATEQTREVHESGLDIEVVVTDIAKCVIQLAEVIASLEGKIANMEELAENTSGMKFSQSISTLKERHIRAVSSKLEPIKLILDNEALSVDGKSITVQSSVEDFSSEQTDPRLNPTYSCPSSPQQHRSYGPPGNSTVPLEFEAADYLGPRSQSVNNAIPSVTSSPAQEIANGGVIQLTPPLESGQVEVYENVNHRPMSEGSLQVDLLLENSMPDNKYAMAKEDVGFQRGPDVTTLVKNDLIEPLGLEHERVQSFGRHVHIETNNSEVLSSSTQPGHGLGGNFSSALELQLVAEGDSIIGNVNVRLVGKESFGFGGAKQEESSPSGYQDKKGASESYRYPDEAQRRSSDSSPVRVGERVKDRTATGYQLPSTTLGYEDQVELMERGVGKMSEASGTRGLLLEDVEGKPGLQRKQQHEAYHRTLAANRKGSGEARRPYSGSGGFSYSRIGKFEDNQGKRNGFDNSGADNQGVVGISSRSRKNQSVGTGEDRGYNDYLSGFGRGFRENPDADRNELFHSRAGRNEEYLQRQRLEETDSYPVWSSSSNRQPIEVRTVSQFGWVSRGREDLRIAKGFETIEIETSRMPPPQEMWERSSASKRNFEQKATQSDGNWSTSEFPSFSSGRFQRAQQFGTPRYESAGDGEHEQLRDELGEMGRYAVDVSKDSAQGSDKSKDEVVSTEQEVLRMEKRFQSTKTGLSTGPKTQERWDVPSSSTSGPEQREAQFDPAKDESLFSGAPGDEDYQQRPEATVPVGVSRGGGRARDFSEESLNGRGPGERAQTTERVPFSQENWEVSSSSRRDFDQRGKPSLRANLTKARALGRDDSNYDNSNDGDYYGRDGRDTGSYRRGRQWQDGQDRSSDMEDDSERGMGPNTPRQQETRPTSSSSTEVYERSKNLPVLKSSRPDDDKFEQLLEEVEALLNEGREGLGGRIEVGVAERMLYEAADLCGKAVALRPSSLVGVGLWGNTLLLHGELKLRLSQNLRSMLPEPSPQGINRRDAWEAEQDLEALENTLQQVSEECEELLVEAGRKYRLALSLDRTDVRALYNWGLALCYRGQLISEEGGERAAQDADKVYLAAIDKFEAMMGFNQKYAPGALLNWGLAMRDRSRLRPMGSRERIKLLAQAKEMFQDALRIDPNYGQARGAVAACTVELKELQEFEEPRGPERGGRQQSKNWWG